MACACAADSAHSWVARRAEVVRQMRLGHGNIVEPYGAWVGPRSWGPITRSTPMASGILRSEAKLRPAGVGALLGKRTPLYADHEYRQGRAVRGALDPQLGYRYSW